ncbi:hypothetical protein SUGI_0189310 [Cryptomeria japonica]|nr:hypothetical protein SUGI_0189310 [Cryptomeria japonica]
MTPKEAFTGSKPDISHLKIFGSPIYVHVPKEKRTNLDPSRKKGILVGYSESSKAFKIYIPGQRYVEVSWDVTFEEDIAFKKSKGSCVIDETNDNQDINVDSNPEIQREHVEPPPQDDHDDPPEPMNPTDIPSDIVITKKRPLWVGNTIQEAERFAAPSGTFRQTKRP